MHRAIRPPVDTGSGRSQGERWEEEHWDGQGTSWTGCEQQAESENINLSSS